MSLAMLVYIISVIPTIKVVSVILLAIIGLFALGWFISSSVDLDVYGHYGEKDPKVIGAHSTRKQLKKLLTPAIIFLTLAVFTPSKETLYIMVAAYGVEKMIENPIAKDLASDGVDVLKQLMAHAKKELAEDVPKAEK